MSQNRSRKARSVNQQGIFSGLADLFARLFSQPANQREGMYRDENRIGESQQQPTSSGIGDNGLMMATQATDEFADQEEQTPTPIQSSRRSPRPKPSRKTPADNRSGFWPVFWTVTGSVSILLNVVLIFGLLIVGRQLFVLKALVSDDLLSGLYENFVLMDDATITTQVHVSKDIPVTFNLPLDQETVVSLTQDTSIYGAYVSLNSGGVVINAPADIVLPVGQQLPVRLQLSVPVSVTVPVELDVPVSIPLSSTELHEPFVGLQSVIGEFYQGTLPNIKQPEDLAFCQKFPSLCELYFK